MRITVFGAGGVGGFYGARLQSAGHDVSFVARGSQLAALRERGLEIASPTGNLSLGTVRVTDDPREVGESDLVIVAVKSWQLAAAAATMRPLIGEHTTVLPLLNGVEAAEQLAQSLGTRDVLKGLTRIISFIETPGRIRHAGAQPYVALGEIDNQKSTRAQQVVDAFRDAGVAAEIPTDIDVALWEKFLFVVPMGGMGAVTRAPIGVVRTIPETRALLHRAMGEIDAVARKRGIAMRDGIVDRALAFMDTLPAAGTASLQRDIAEGRRSELDAWNGAVVRLGAEVGVPTPTHDFIYHSLLPQELAARGEIASP